MHRIFVTGAAGFVGFHTALALHARKNQVLGFDNFNAYYSPKLKRSRAAILLKNGINIIEGDICNKALLNETIQAFQPTHIVHLAAQAGVRYSLTHPDEYIKANIEGFLNILEACRQNSRIKLIYASSSSVYGLNTKIPFSLEDNTDRQSNLYGVTKKSNELMADSYHHLFGIPVTGLRFFTVYGPWGRPDMAYFSFSEAILADKVIDVYGEGKLKRDFTYIDDIVEGILAAVDLGSARAIFNLGNCQPVEVLELITLLEKAIGKKAKKRFLPIQPGEMQATYADISESTKQLGYIPKVSLSEGIERFVAWHKSYRVSSSDGQ